MNWQFKIGSFSEDDPLDVSDSGELGGSHPWLSSSSDDVVDISMSDPLDIGSALLLFLIGGDSSSVSWRT